MDDLLNQMPSTVYLVVRQNDDRFRQFFGRSDKRLYLFAAHVRQYLRHNVGQYYAEPISFRVFVRDSDHSDIEWREVTNEFIGSGDE